MRPGRTVVGLLAIVAVVAPAQARKIVVAANGVDGASCGVAAAPCRSIGQAVANAADGDTVEVGPGRYAEAGEPSSGCQCMVKVDKRVAVVSRDGAAVTLVDAQGFPYAVAVLASDAAFGKQNKGFTVRGGNTAGVYLDAAATHATIAGNTVLGAANGFLLNGPGAAVTANRSLANVTGFSLGGDMQTVVRNVALASLGDGFLVGGNGIAFSRNVATANGQDGFDVLGGPTTLTRNAAIGNTSAGVDVEESIAVGFVGGTLLGNDAAGMNCGVENAASGTTTATNVFWGAPSGPGPEPADAVCNLAGGSVVTDPPASKEIAVTPPAER